MIKYEFNGNNGSTMTSTDIGRIVHTLTHTHTHTHTHTDTHTHTLTLTHAHTQTHTHTRSHLVICALTFTNVALDANLSAFKTSPLGSSPWGIVTITEVRDPPPKLPWGKFKKNEEKKCRCQKKK